MEPFDIERLKNYIKDRMKDSERLERQADRHGDEDGVSFHAGHAFAYEDVLAQIEGMEDEQ